MASGLVLVLQRQSAEGVALSWAPAEGAAGYQIFVAARRLSPEELEAAAVLGGTEECIVAKAGPETASAIDDLSPQGEPRHYGVAAVLRDGTVKAARFRAGPAAGPGSARLSALSGRGGERPKVRTPAAAGPLASSPSRAAEEAATPGVATRPAPGGDTRPRSAPPAGSNAQARPLPAEAMTEPPPPAAAVRLEQALDLRMQAATQTWDGLRIFWERDPRAAAYEVIASDHPLARDEVADALAGRVDFTTVAAVPPTITCVIDNTTPREARGYYAVLVRFRDGRRGEHPFKVGDAAASWRPAAPFLNPNRTGELRAEVEALLAEAREQWERWKAEKDGGARHEAKRIAGDALLIWPDYPAAKSLLEEMV